MLAMVPGSDLMMTSDAEGVKVYNSITLEEMPFPSKMSGVTEAISGM
jgi:hypothetical protein